MARIPTKPRTFRATEKLWRRAMLTAENADQNLPDAIRDFVAWYAHVPGARLPQRPASTAVPTDEEVAEAIAAEESSPGSRSNPT